MNTRAPVRVLIAGGGVAALEATLALRALAGKRVTIELLAPDPHFVGRPLAVAEPFGGGRVEGIDLAGLAEACGAQLTLGALAAVDADAQVARTANGTEIAYDALVVATGARPQDAVAGALTYHGLADGDRIRELLAEAEAGTTGRIVFAVPGGITWPLPLYELALQTATQLRARAVAVELALVTTEQTPLGLFGASASEAVAALLRELGIAVHTGCSPGVASAGRLSLVPYGSLAADRVVALPRLEGVPIPGLPHDTDGFISVDSSGRVRGCESIYAAGDITAGPVKQGGLAAQQALAVAETIAAAAGAEVYPHPARPVLRGMLLTGGAPLYLRTELGRSADETSTASAEPLWWPPDKRIGRHLAPFVAAQARSVPSTISISTPPKRGGIEHAQHRMT